MFWLWIAVVTSVTVSPRRASWSGFTQKRMAYCPAPNTAVLPIPGTSSVAHLEENVAAAEIKLSDDEFAKLSELGEQNA